MSDIRRPMPDVTDLCRPFWTCGAQGVLRLQRCTSCRRLCHPPALRCPHEHATLEWVELSGRGRLESWTLNRHQWFPGYRPPYVIAFVNPIEDTGARLLTNLVNTDPGELVVGMALRVVFERLIDGHDEVYVPLFEPAR
ncbi:DNA-binding protein [Mycobacterium asiaticum DSM 44297]|uniref:DNA-binding protein n=1 Tax=Mycobacterium asiaticum TaxID=1790 RepID=A0A1A3KQ49_MYCAS|nr:DNA-binding protein [Mycobacterium asiaticum]OBJ51178.1 DNA-binding protein [Mycobacterium asiaticum]OBJ87140.1 DNA-binding protein [Mycobacterium asiaticum]ORA18893.1 DNA-binding protein [Mycobacterium asiaticum DSM 44297]